MRPALVVLFAAACGRLAFDPIAHNGDASADGDGTTDGGFVGSNMVYVKASNPRSGATFATALSLSSDGTTLAVGSINESSAATGIDGNQADTSLVRAGAVYIYTRGPTWNQQAYVKASNTRANAQFGFSVALSGDGNTLAIGSPYESSTAIGIDGNQSAGAQATVGAVYVFTRAGGTWAQTTYVKASNARPSSDFGWTVALSADGTTLAVGAVEETSNATGINGNQADTSIAGAGAVYVFTRVGPSWTQQAYVKASNPRNGAYFGTGLALSSDGSTLIVGSSGEQSASTGIDGSQAGSSFSDAGAVYAFTRAGTTWTQQAYIKPSNTQDSGEFGAAISLANDGNTLAVGSWGEASNARGVGGNQADTSMSTSGATYMFSRSNTTWTQQAYIKATNTRIAAQFGFAVALAADASTLVVGSPTETSHATGVNGDQTDSSVPSAGAAYIYTRSGTTWSPRTYVKAINTRAMAYFGFSVGINSGGGVLAAGSYGESSGSTDPNDSSAGSAGAVYVYQ